MTVSSTLYEVRRLFAPPPRLKVSEWADRYRFLSPESSAEPGRWRTSRAEYLRGILDAFNEPASETVVVMCSSQVGKTETLANVVGYFSSQDPSPVLFLQPTLEMSEAYSKDRLAPMIRDSPALFEIMGDRPRGENTLLHKQFPGGHVSLAGANSPASLASRPVRILLADEVDRFPPSAGGEGDPVNLAKKRTMTFWNRKIGLVSTPTNRGSSRIEKAFLESDQRRYFVPCPHCGEHQVLVWSQVKWRPEEPSRAWYECAKCNRPIENSSKQKMLRGGDWRATAPFTNCAGFHLNELYSPWRSFGDVATDFLKAKDDPQRLKVWVNTSLGETWEEQQGQTLDFEELAARAEDYPQCFIPKGGLLLTAGVDVQADRLAIVIKAWGRGEQSWLIHWSEIFGDTSQPSVWEQLDDLLSLPFEHHDGIELSVSVAAIDSGFRPQSVYQFCRGRHSFKCIPTKGSGTPNKPILSRPSLQDVNVRGKVVKNGIKLFTVGTDVCKSLVYSRLQLMAGQQGFMHFPQGLPEDYFAQLTAEKCVTKFIQGQPTHQWIKVRTRNEALDCEVLAYVAAVANGLSTMNWDRLRSKLFPSTAAEETKPKATKPKGSIKETGRGFATNW
ncbi:phage terminase large subunit family protein [Dolichospermum sp. UHCC 0684]|uniref:phage terminase large subunit family protein n=2 Tax=unclassified Dolichospermum TaxID=2622029 RepID=UPI001C2CC59B|nr:phage terminase large subunit family protein [Dolichospermum sp. UHCC 0260]MEA5529030.1 phage terminase large subunit family protein [Dolichospermum sp. UHCC 0684]